MPPEAIPAIAGVVLLSLLIATWAAWKRPAPTLEEYLYGGNRLPWAVSSGIGSIFSTSITFTALLSGGYVFGWQIIPSLIVGCVCGTLMLTSFLKQREAIEFLDDPVTSDRRLGGAYLLLPLRQKTTPLSPESARVYVIVAYSISLLLYSSLLVMELAVTRATLGSLLPLDPAELWLLVLVLVGVCFAYVYIGGFLGVLLTDHAQVGIIVAFGGAVFVELDWGTVANSLPAATAAAVLAGTLFELALLHIAVFSAAAFFTLCSVDQWYRTAATLPRKSVRPALWLSSTLMAAGASLPVIVGSMANAITIIPPGTTNRVSIYILAAALDSFAPGSRLLLLMALTCVTLTTLDTYLITIQQLYYEFSTRIRASAVSSYLLVDYLFCWPDVRLVALGILVAASFFSSKIDATNMYTFGVASITAVILLLPIFLFKRIARFGGLPTVPLVAGFLTYPFAIAIMHKFVGSVHLHLYLIADAALLATACGILTEYLRCKARSFLSRYRLVR